ncbi:MAG: FkbM family methyltransferase [Gemmataceae bacterium]|nr:FkbM family methyltransferase [Gemmataceae bacterium]
MVPPLPADERLLVDIRSPGTPGFKLAVGRTEADGAAAYGRDPVAEHLARTGTLACEDAVRLMLALSRPGQLVVDIGCHVGQFSLAAAAAGRRVFALDASRRNLSLLRASIEANGYDQVETCHAVASDAPGELRFNEAGPFGGVIPDACQHGGIVPAVRVGDLLASRPGPVGFVKIDVEGFEVEALTGMADWLAGNGWPPLLFESHLMGHEERGRSVADLRELVRRIGYPHQHLVAGSRLFTLPPDHPQPSIVADFLATVDPSPRMPQRAAAQAMAGGDFADLLIYDAECHAKEPEALLALGRHFRASRHPILDEPRVRFFLGEIGKHPDPRVKEAFSPWPVGGAFSLLRLQRMASQGFAYIMRALAWPFRKAG